MASLSFLSYMVALALQEDMQRLDESWEDIKKSHPDEDLSELSEWVVLDVSVNKVGNHPFT